VSLAAVVRAPQFVRLLLLVLLGRLPNGMVPLALVFYARGSGHDWASSGALAAAYSGGNAIGAPPLARWMDRRGQTGVLLLTGVASAAALVAVPAVPTAAAAVATAFAGLAFPPLEQAQRTLWPRLLPPEHLARAYALDASAQGLLFVSGPPFVLAGIALAGDAGGLYGAAALGLAGTVAFAATSASRTWRPGARADTHWLGPLRSGHLVAVYVANALAALTIGTLAVGLTAYAEGHGSRDLAGWLLTVNAVGGVVGGFAFAASSRSGAGRLGARAAVLSCGLGGVWALLALLPPLAPMFAVAALSGAALPPLLTCFYVSIDRLAPAGVASEAFGWAITAFLVGFSAGAGVAGALVEHHLSAAFLVGTATALAAAGIARAAIP
jgi:MFS family permease